MTGGMLHIDGAWSQGRGAAFASADPATGESVWEGRAADRDDVNDAVLAARKAFPAWASLGFERRLLVLQAYANELERRRDDIAKLISRESGKPLWEARGEVGLMVNKIAVTADAWRQRCAETSRKIGNDLGVTRYKPHGVLAVLGPFNMPGHLPNGQIVPALLAGNAVIFKPSEFTPAVGGAIVAAWRSASEDTPIASAALSLLLGDGAVGSALVEHDAIDGVLFTGGYKTGVAISRANAHRPERIIALELGGNNPLVVWPPADPDAAGYIAALSAFLTAGQRCTCARRLIVPANADGERVVEKLLDWARRLRVGSWADLPEAFMGPVISRAAADRLLAGQRDLLAVGGRAILPMKQSPVCPRLLTPGIIDMTHASRCFDEEWFGPLLQIVRVPDFDSAINEANHTSYGLAAGLISADETLYRRFVAEVRAGVINWNHQTTGASGQLPFGGVGRSGNHRPAGYFAVDFGAYPVASLESSAVPAAPSRGQLPPGFNA